MAKKIKDSVHKKKNEVSKELPHDSKLYDYILIALFALFVVLFTTFKISGDDDIFWHLETGRYIVENKTVPSSDVFGFASAGEEWVPFEWGWDVLSYLIYSISGYTGISILRVLIFLLIFYLFFRLIQKLKLNLPLSLLIFTVLLFAIMDRLIPKPQIISYLFFSVLLYIFISLQSFSRDKIKILYLLPVIFVIWCNMHMGVLAGMGIFTLFVLSELIIYLKPHSFSKIKPLHKGDFKKLVLVYVISIIALLLNPHFIKTYQYVYAHLNMQMLRDVFEWYSPFNKVFSGTLYQYLYIFFLAFSLNALYYAFKTKNLFIALVIVVFAIFSISSSRYTIDFMIIASIFIIISLSNIWDSSKFKILLSSRYTKLVLSAILLGLIISLPWNNLYLYMNYIRSTGFGVENHDYPVKVFRFIRENGIHEKGSRPFNSFGIGGYFIWEFKGKKNFIDSRNLSDMQYFDYKIVNNKLQGFEKKIEKFDFEYFIWFYPDLVNDSYELTKAVPSYLINNPDKWKLIYWDDQSMLFVKNDDKFRDLISKYEYKFVNPIFYIHQREPLLNALKENRDAVINEIRRKYEQEPQGNFINSIIRSFKLPIGK